MGMGTIIFWIFICLFIALIVNADDDDYFF